MRAVAAERVEDAASGHAEVAELRRKLERAEALRLEAESQCARAQARAELAESRFAYLAAGINPQWVTTVLGGLRWLSLRAPNDGSGVDLRVGADGLLRSSAETSEEMAERFARAQG